MKKILIFLSLFVIVHAAFSAEYIDGRIRLVINENTGRFSLYYMADIAKEEYLPFFVDKDPRTSFLSLMVNNRSYRLGDSSFFKTKLEGTNSNPVLIFDSSLLTVTQEFVFVRTGSSSLTNGIRISITITNKSEKPINAGIRFLIDTNLGEKSNAHFYTNLKQIDGEIIIDGSSPDSYWVSKNSRFSLMGSVDGENLTRPDLIHFANWKRLNDTAWRVIYTPGRNFNLLPYSIDDSAVCYYYEPRLIPRDGSRNVSLLLSSLMDSVAGDNARNSIPVSEDPVRFVESGTLQEDLSSLIRETAAKVEGNTNEAIRMDLITLRDLAARVDEYISSGAPVPDDELEAIALLIYRIKSKYAIP